MLLRGTGKYKELLPALTVPQIDSTLKIGRAILMTDDISYAIPEVVNHISRHHADIITRRKQVFIVPQSTQKNLMTLNGATLTNGQEVELKAGDVFTLLRGVFSYELIDITNSKPPQIQSQTQEVNRTTSDQGKEGNEGTKGIENGSVVVNEETNTQTEVVLEGDTPPAKVQQQQKEVLTDSTQDSSSGQNNNNGNNDEGADSGESTQELNKSETLNPSLTKSASTSSSSSLLDALASVDPPRTINLADSNEKEAPTEFKQEREKETAVSLPSLSRQTSTESNTSMIDSLLTSSECPICFETLVLSYTTKCSHSFCYTCLCDIWDSGHRVCPTCSQSFELEQCVHNRFADEITSNVMNDIATRTGNDEEMKAWNARLAAAKEVEKERKLAEASAPHPKGSKKKHHKKRSKDEAKRGSHFLLPGRQVNASASSSRASHIIPQSAIPKVIRDNTPINLTTDNLPAAVPMTLSYLEATKGIIGNSSSSSSGRKRKREQNHQNPPMPKAKDYSGEVIDLT